MDVACQTYRTAKIEETKVSITVFLRIRGILVVIICLVVIFSGSGVHLFFVGDGVVVLLSFSISVTIWTGSQILFPVEVFGA